MLAPLSQTFLYDALWWRWVSMFIVHIPLLLGETIAMVTFLYIYYDRLKVHVRNELTDKSFHKLHLLSVLFPLSLFVTHVCTIATASWWFLLPASLPTACSPC